VGVQVPSQAPNKKGHSLSVAFFILGGVGT